MVDAGRGLLRALPPDARLDRGRAGAAEHPRTTSAPAPAGLQWVMNGYLLTIAVFVVTAGRLGDMFGRKRVFLVGMVRLRASARSSPAPPATQATLIARPRPAGGRRGADAAALPGDRLQRLPACRAGAGARDLGRGLGRGAGDRAAGRRRPGRSRLAGDLLDQPAGGGGRDRDHGARRARVDRPRRRARRSTWPGLLALSVGLTAVVLALVQARAWSAATTVAAGAGRPRLAWSPSGGSSTGSAEPIVDFDAVPQRPLLRRQRRRLRPGRRLLGGDVLPAPVPAGRARPLGRSSAGC